MRLFWNPRHRAHSGRHEVYRGRSVPCHETPARLDFVMAELARRPLGELCEAVEPDAAVLRRIHDPAYLDSLAGAWNEWLALDPANAEVDVLPSIWPVRGLRTDVAPTNFEARVGRYLFDSGSPLTAGTWEAARAGAACAIAAARAVASGATRGAAALTRPPGHHAGSDFFGGYCFLNNAWPPRPFATAAPRASRCSTSTTTTATALRPSSMHAPTC